MMAKYKRHLPLIMTLLVIVIYGAKIISTRAELAFDQKKLVSYDLSVEDYPGIEAGVTSFLLVGFLNLLDPWVSISSSAHIRMWAMFIYLVSSFLLFQSFKEKARTELSLLFLLLLFTSRFPFLWLSSELIAGSFLMLLLWSIARDLPFAVVSVFVALFALSKPDLIFSGIGVALFLAYSYGMASEDRLKNAIVPFVIILVLLIPGILQNGLGYFKPQGRALFSFGQHYAAVVAKHQIVSEKPDPWLDWEAYFFPVWGQQEGVLDAIRSDPARYLDFVFLSMSQSVKNFIRSNLIILLPVSVYCWVRWKQRKLKTVALLLLTGLIPITLLSFTHTRYIARFYPLFLFVIYGYIAEVESKKEYRPIVLYLLALLALQLYQVFPVFHSGYWFPD